MSDRDAQTDRSATAPLRATRSPSRPTRVAIACATYAVLILGWAGAMVASVDVEDGVPLLYAAAGAALCGALVVFALWPRRSHARYQSNGSAQPTG